MLSHCVLPLAHFGQDLVYSGITFFTYGWVFLLMAGLFTYGKLVWSFLLTVEIRFGLFAYGGKSAWSFLLTVLLVRKLGLVFSAYGSPVRKLGLVFSAYGSPTISRKNEL